MPIDYHMHLESDSHYDRCRYDTGRIAVYVDAARLAGLVEIGITEHWHRFSQARPLMSRLMDAPGVHPEVPGWLGRFFTESLDAYVEAVEKAKDEGLPVLLGLEVDYIPGEEEATRELLDRYPWDFVLGSIHYLDTWAVDASPDHGWPGQDVDEAYAKYFARLAEAARSGLFDVLAHPDLIKKFGHRPSASPQPLYEDAAQAAREGGVAIEISSAGLHKPVGEPYPGLELLEAFARHQVPITFASDAHEPEEVGRDIGRLAAYARRAGYAEVSRFRRRRRYSMPLEEADAAR